MRSVGRTLEFAVDNAAANARGFLRGGVADAFGQAIAVIVFRFVGSDRERARQERGDGDASKMRIDAVANARCAGRIRAWHAAQRDRPAIRHDEPIPNNEQALIAVTGCGVVRADQPRALRH